MLGKLLSALSLTDSDGRKLSDDPLIEILLRICSEYVDPGLETLVFTRGLPAERQHSSPLNIKLRQHHAYRTPENGDMLLYLAAANEYAVLRFDGSKRWT